MPGPTAFKRVALGCLLALAPAGIGCRTVGGIMYLLSPRQWVEPEYKLVGGRMVVLVEPTRSDFDNPLFAAALQRRMADVLREQKVDVKVTSFEEVQRLRQANPEFARWSLQRIGREAEARYVLYLRITSLNLIDSPDAPMITPLVELAAKLIGVEEADEHAVLWPDSVREREGRSFRYQRQPVEQSGQEAIDREARNLGLDTADRLARYFYKYDAEEDPPRAR